MRDALFITFILIFIFVVIGVLYNIATPYLIKFGIGQDIVATMEKDGGIFRSLDFGRTWSRDSQDNDFLRSNVYSIHFSPDDASSIYAATSEGLYKTSDAGENWELSDTKFVQDVKAFSQDPADSRRMYLGGRDGGSHILKTRTGEFYEVYSSTGDDILGIWVDPFDPVNVYAGTRGGFLLESDDFGESWRVKKEFDGAFEQLLILKDSMYAIVGGNRLLHSQNRGASWVDVTLSGISNIKQIAVSPSDDMILYLTSANGLFRSQNSGATFSKVKILSEDTSRVHAVAVDPQVPNVIYLGVGNQVHRTDDGGVTWRIKTLDTQRNIASIRVSPDKSSAVFIGLLNLK